MKPGVKRLHIRVIFDKIKVECSQTTEHEEVGAPVACHCRDHLYVAERPFKHQ